MSQVTNFVTPGTPLTMAGLKAHLDACYAAAVDSNRGSSAPSNPLEGMLWLDSSGGPTAEVLRRYTVAAGWVPIMTFNITSGTITQLHGILDEDDMASDSAVLPPSQQSVKAYVDPDKVPAGAMMDWPTETPPTGWLERNGASLVRTDYPALFAVIGTMFGAADATHFNLPDDRGLFGRWWAHGQATDPDRATRTAPAATGATLTAGDHVGTEQDHTLEAHTHTQGVQLTANTANGAQGAYAVGDTSFATGSTGGNETRPVNRAYMPIIKY